MNFLFSQFLYPPLSPNNRYCSTLNPHSPLKQPYIGYKMRAKPKERDNLIEDSPMRWPWVGRDHKTPTRRFWLTWVMKWWISIWWALTWLYKVKDLLVGSSIQWALGLKNSSAFVYHVLPHCKICLPRAAPLLDFERESHFIYQEKK